MRFKMPLSCLVLLLAFGLSGCASMITFFGPLKSKLVDGDKTIGELSSYKYDLKAEANRVFVKKTPLCKEKVEKLRVAKKQRRGVYMALIEAPVFGLGLIDWVETAAISEDSIRVQPLATYDTGKLIACGNRQPAAGEVLIIEGRQPRFVYRGTTNAEGILHLDSLLTGVKGPIALDISLASDRTVSLNYMYEPDRPVQ